MKETLTMSTREIDRVTIMDQVLLGQMNQKKACQALDISYRQVKRIFKRFKASGAEGIVHKSRGKRSPKKMQDTEIKKITDIIVKNYSDFKPTFASEKLEEIHGIKRSKETIRKIMIDAGLWRAKTHRRIKTYQMRQRRSCEGELIQMDGSPHDWFEGRAPKCCLIVFIDDATSKLLELRFVEVESTHAYFQALNSYLLKCGRPASMYSDKHSIFKINTSSNGSSCKTESPSNTQLGRALEELGIELITANTPQAKGRVERANKTLQDRLIKEMRLKNISSIEEANAYLPEFIKAHNRNFAVAANSSLNAHRPLLKSHDLDLILCKQIPRILSKQLTFQYENVIFQIQTKRPKYALRKQSVLVLDAPNEHIKVVYKKSLLDYTMISKDQKQALEMDAKTLSHHLDSKKKSASKQKVKPTKDHPWKKQAKADYDKKMSKLTALKKGLTALSKAIFVTLGGHF